MLRLYHRGRGNGLLAKNQGKEDPYGNFKMNESRVIKEAKEELAKTFASVGEPRI